MTTNRTASLLVFFQETHANLKVELFTKLALTVHLVVLLLISTAVKAFLEMDRF